MGYIYIITNTNNGKMYIGQTVKLGTRMRAHYKLRGNSLLYDDVRIFTWDSFVVDIAECPTESLDRVEKWLIHHCNTLHPSGYNKTRGGSNGARSDIAKMNMSIATRKYMATQSPQDREDRYHKISLANKQYYASLTDMEKHAYVGKIHNISPEQFQQRLSKAMNTSRNRTSEQKRLSNQQRSMSLKRAYQNTPDDELARRHRNISTAKQGKPLSEEHKRKLSEAAKRRWGKA